MFKLVALAALLLAGIVSADQFKESTDFVESSLGNRFCVAVGQKPENSAYILSLQVVLESSATVRVAWGLDAEHSYTSPAASPIHTIDIHNLDGVDTNGYNSFLFSQTGVVAGSVESDSKVLKVIAAYVATDAASTEDFQEDADDVCRNYMEIEDDGNDDDEDDDDDDDDEEHRNGDDAKNKHGHKHHSNTTDTATSARRAVPVLAVVSLSVGCFLLCTAATICCCMCCRRRAAARKQEAIELAEKKAKDVEAPKPNLAAAFANPGFFAPTPMPVVAGQQTPMPPMMPAQMMPQMMMMAPPGYMPVYAPHAVPQPATPTSQ